MAQGVCFPSIYILSWKSPHGAHVLLRPNNLQKHKNRQQEDKQGTEATK